MVFCPSSLLAAGAGGNNVLDGNLIWNTCLESQDHGPFNSEWCDPIVFSLRL